MNTDQKKREAVRQSFRDRGETISSWAENHQFPRTEVYAVLAGRVLGTRGIGHNIAVALGLKPEPKELNDEEN